MDPKLDPAHQSSPQMAKQWPCKVAALVAVIAGSLLLMGGGFHLEAVISIALAEDRPFDYRLVSLIATGGIIFAPGLLSVIACRWLWQGREWAYLACISATTILMIYLVLLLFMEAPEPPAKSSVGSELDFFSVLVGVYLLILVAVWIWLRRTRPPVIAVGR